MMTYAELETFFTGLIATAQARGIVCGITSGMACVHFGVAATTRDCDVLCAAESAADFFELIAATEVRGKKPTYRGNLSPPLDARWLRGGWTAHVQWKIAPGDEVCLDVFGVAPRGSTPWEERRQGFYVDPHVVAEMKRTNRDKDWPFATALGSELLEVGEPRGWLHIHDLETLRRFKGTPVPKALSATRPILRLAPFADTLRLKRLLTAERVFWSEMDQLRIRIYQRHLRPYTSAVRREGGGRAQLRESHAIRLRCAAAHLPPQPLGDYGLARMVREVRETVGVTVGADVLEWMPHALENFHGLST